MAGAAQTKWAHGAARATLLVLSFSLGLVLLEHGLNWHYETSAVTGPYEMVEAYASPYVLRMSPGQIGQSHGLRRAGDVEARPQPGVVRILSYGDSIGSGYKLANEEMYTHLLEQRSSADPALPRLEVLNMNRGHSPTLYSFHVRQDVEELNPAAVLMQIELSNDISDEAHVRASGEDPDGLPTMIHGYRYILSHHGYLLAPITITGSPIERTMLYARLSRWVARVLQKISPNPVFSDDSRKFYYSRSGDRFFLSAARLERGYTRMLDSIAGTQRYLERQGIPLLVLITPPRHAFSDSPFREHGLSLLARADSDLTRLGIDHVSAREVMAAGGGAALFMDFCHPTAEGNAVIAGLLEGAVPEWLAKQR